MVGVSASVNLPLHHKVQNFSSGTVSPGWSRKKGRKMVVVVVTSAVKIIHPLWAQDISDVIAVKERRQIDNA